MAKSGRREAGFTLVEMLMSTVLAMIIAGGMASFLFSSFHVIQVLGSRNANVQTDLIYGLEKLSKEIQESPVYPQVPFVGSAEEVSFPAMFSDQNKTPLLAEFRLGQVQEVKAGSQFEFKKIRYFFDSSRKALMRQSGESEPELFLEHVGAAQFFYSIHPAGESGGSWRDDG